MRILDIDLVEKICKLGLTSKQARVYAVVLGSKGNTVSEISEGAALHEQDIYKIIERLEKAGLVTKTVAKPTRIEAIPVEKALNNLIENQQKIVEQHKIIVKEIVEKVKKKGEPDLLNDNEKFIVLPGKSEALKNRGVLRIAKTKRTYDLIIARKLCTGGIPNLIEAFSSYPCVVKIRMLISTSEGDTNLDEIYNKKNWPLNVSHLNITVKKTNEQQTLYYAIFDDEEVWIPLELYSPSSMLATNSKAVVRIAIENFNKIWEDKNTITLLEKKAIVQLQRGGSSTEQRTHTVSKRNN